MSYDYDSNLTYPTEPNGVYNDFIPARVYYDDPYYDDPNYGASGEKISDVSTNGPFKEISKLCGFPTFCDQSIMTLSPNVTLLENSYCCMPAAYVFISCYVLLAISILMANTLVVINFVGSKRNVKRSAAKVSLAAADSLTAILVLTTVTYNFSWTIRSTPAEINIKQLSLQGSNIAIAAGMFYMLTFTSSLYHLAFLGLQRLYAIKWPIKYKSLNNRTILIALAIVWGLSLFVSTIPVWFPKYMIYTYFVTNFIFFVSLKTYISGVTSPGPAYVLMAGLILIPFTILLVSGLVCGYLIYKRSGASRHLTNNRSHVGTLNRKDVKAYEMISIMQASFTFTMLPLFIVSVLFYCGILHCANPVPFVATTFVSMCNRLLNPIIYSWRDREFRNFIKGMFKKDLRKQSLTTSTEI